MAPNIDKDTGSPVKLDDIGKQLSSKGDSAGPFAFHYCQSELRPVR
jgi:hypothetical protein